MPLLSIHIWPPMASTRRRLMARPSPVPPNLRVVEASIWLKVAEQPILAFRRNPESCVVHGEVELERRPLLN